MVVDTDNSTTICSDWNWPVRIQDKKGVLYCSNSPLNNETLSKPSRLKIGNPRSLEVYRNLPYIGFIKLNASLTWNTMRLPGNVFRMIFLNLFNHTCL